MGATGEISSSAPKLAQQCTAMHGSQRSTIPAQLPVAPNSWFQSRHSAPTAAPSQATLPTEVSFTALQNPIAPLGKTQELRGLKMGKLEMRSCLLTSVEALQMHANIENLNLRSSWQTQHCKHANNPARESIRVLRKLLHQHHSKPLLHTTPCMLHAQDFEG